jgi:hypothetical protein
VEPERFRKGGGGLAIPLRERHYETDETTPRHFKESPSRLFDFRGVPLASERSRRRLVLCPAHPLHQSAAPSLSSGCAAGMRVSAAHERRSSPLLCDHDRTRASLLIVAWL